MVDVADGADVDVRLVADISAEAVLGEQVLTQQTCDRAVRTATVAGSIAAAYLCAPPGGSKCGKA